MKRQGWMLGRLRRLACTDELRDVLLALIEAVHEVDDRYDDHEDRLRALEAKARDYQEDGALAVRDIEWWQSIPHSGRFNAWMEERERAETAERERDEAQNGFDAAVNIINRHSDTIAALREDLAAALASATPAEGGEGC